MKNFLVIINLVILLTSCEKLDFDLFSDLKFNSKADDELIHPDVNLEISSWERLDSLTESSLTDVSFYNESIGIISGYFGRVFITKDGGENWRSIYTNTGMTYTCVYALNENTFFAARLGLFKSSDNGTSWKSCNFPQGNNTIWEIWFKDSKNGFLACNAGTYKTSDAGENWEKVSDASARNLQFTSEDIGYFSYGNTAVSISDGQNSLPSNGDIYRTINGGEKWVKMGLNIKEITAMSFISDKTGFFGTIDGKLYKTSDGGESCTLIENTGKSLRVLFFVNENQGCICTGTGLSITLDGGHTFNEEYLVKDHRQIYHMDFPTPSVGYAIGNGGLLFKRMQ